MYINRNIQQLHFCKCLTSHVTEHLFTNFPVYSTYKMLVYTQAIFAVRGLKFGSSLFLFGWAHVAPQAWSCGANIQCVELACELVEWRVRVDRRWSSCVLISKTESECVRFYTVVVLRCQVLWDLLLCCWVNISNILKEDVTFTGPCCSWHG